MKWLKNKLNGHYHFILAFGIAGIVFAAMNFNNPPLFQNTDNFVLFAQEEIKLEKEVQVSSGDLGSNKELDIQKDAIISGNLFADKITIDKNSQINGNVSYNKLKIEKEARILGTKTTPVSLPIANLQDIPDFQIGTQDFKFEGQDNTLVVGNYRDILLDKQSRLILDGGVYNLRKLELEENSTLIFNSPAILNIQFKLKGQEHIAILPGNNNLKPTDLVINYLGIKPKNEKVEKEDDDNEIESEMDNQEKKDHKAGKIGRPIVFGKESFLNFKLLAPKAGVHIGEFSILRGQMLARRVKTGKDVVLGRELTGTKIARQKEILVDPGGGVYPVNILLVLLTTGATFEDALKVVQTVNGRIVGVVSSINLYQIEVPANTAGDLTSMINNLRAMTDLKIDGIFRDFLTPLE